MATRMLVSIKSAIKGYHVYRNDVSVGTVLNYIPEPENEYSGSAFIVKTGEIVVGHVPEGLCQLFKQLINDGSVLEIKAEMSGCARPSSNGTFVRGGGIEIPCSYKLFGRGEKKSEVRLFLKKEFKKLTV